MIKIAFRQNLKYPLQLLLWTILRDIESDLIFVFLNFNSAIYTPIMFLGELLAGLIIYIYQKQFFAKDKIKELSKFASIQLKRVKGQKLFIDNKIKITFLIFYLALCDFVQFVITLSTSKYIKNSGSAEVRLRGLLTIYAALFYYYILRFPIFKHQKFSLIVIGICLVIEIITEYIFQDLSYADFFIFILLIIIMEFFSSMLVAVEKYLFEFNNLNPFFVLMFEGVFGSILSFTYSLFKSSFDDIIRFKKNNSSSDFALLIFALIIYLLLSGLKNIFRVLTTKIYSPATTTFMNYILNPFFLLYFYITEAGERNTVYFIINFIISTILSFIGCVYNEFLILFFCGLERDTHRQIMIRSLNETELGYINNFIENDEVEDNISRNATNG